MKKITLLFFIFSISFFKHALAQVSDSGMELKGKNSLMVSMGSNVNSRTDINVGIFNVDMNSGFSGSIAYQHWFENDWAINFQIGVLGVSVNSSNYLVSSNSIVPIQFGVRYYPKTISLGDAGRIFGGINIGAYHGSISRTTGWFNTHIQTETVFGVQPVIGLDLFIAKWLKIGPAVSYHFINDFKNLNLSHDDYGGFEYGFSFGIVF
jgi:hypothetical protein